MFSKLVAFSAVAQGLLLKKQPNELGNQATDAAGGFEGERNAVYDCSNGIEGAVGRPNANNSAEARRMMAKAAAIGESNAEEGSLDSLRGNTKSVNEFLRHGAQDCDEANAGIDKLKDLEDTAALSRDNFSGPDSDVEAAFEMKDAALEKANQIRREIFDEPIELQVSKK